jgi:SAM-dependent methyltransferase
MISRLIENLVFQRAMRAHIGHSKGDLSHRKATFSDDAYDEWRDESLRLQFETSFPEQSLAGKRVLDFGCGSGQLCSFVKKKGASTVIGSDLSKKQIDLAREREAKERSGCRYILEQDPKRISLPDNSVDVILCFDVMEHVMDYREAMQEWMRVLAPGGSVLIWWSVWWHPYGHHLHTMIPLPWIHAFMSDASLLRVCARIYDTPHFQPRLWHFDENGQRKANPYAGKQQFDDLNKLTIRGFDNTAAATGFVIRRKDVNPFTGATLAGLKKALVKSPWPDFFCSCVVYELQKPA